MNLYAGPWSVQVFSCAIVNGKMDDVQFLLQKGCPVDVESIKTEIVRDNPWNHSVRSKNIQANIDYLKQQGFPIEIDLEALSTANNNNNNNKMSIYGFVLEN